MSLTSLAHRRLVGAAVTTLVLGGLALTPPGSAPALAAPAGEEHLPDLQTIIPTDSFSIVGSGQDREFRYTHLIFNGGEGPLQIQPFYSASAGTYLGRQQIVTHDDNDVWSVTRSRRVADAFVYHAEHGHFHFPLASFGLFKVASGGGLGKPVTMSPKVGFCIADSYIYDTTLEHAGAGHELWGSCSDPTSMRGISVGGADEYDYRDPGQSVPLTGVPDGTYWFRALSDPHNDFVESNESNNEMDVKVTIAGGTVTAGAVREPDTTPCTATLRSPADATTRRGNVALSARTSAPAGSVVRYLIDGTSVGASRSRPTYAVTWDSHDVVDGTHWIAAQVTSPDGRMCTSPVASVRIDNAHGSSLQVHFTDPEDRSEVSGRVAIAASAAASSSVRSVQFALDGERLGKPEHRPPYTLVWNSRKASTGKHRLTATAIDRRGRRARDTITVTVRHTPPPKRIGIDASVMARGNDALTTPPFSTGHSEEVLLALVSYDGPDTPGLQAVSVSGGGLHWHLAKRSNSQAGDSEIWWARAAHRLSDATVSTTATEGGYDGMLSVFSFTNARGVGVASAAGAPTGPPDFYVPAVSEGSWVFAAGNDWDGAVTRAPISGQVVRREWLTEGGDTFWVQSLRAPTTIHRLITIRDTAPRDHRWNYVGAEVLARH